MIMKWKGKEDVCLTSTTCDEKLDQDIEKRKRVIDCNSMIGGVDADLVSYRRNRC